MSTEWKGVVIPTGHDRAEHGWWRVVDGKLHVHAWRHNARTGNNVGAKIGEVELEPGEDPPTLAKAILRSHLPRDRNSFSDPWLGKWNRGFVPL